MSQKQRLQIRQDIREKRRQLNPQQQQQHAQALSHHVCRSRLFQNAKRIACYLPADGEIDPLPIIQTAWQRKKDVYLPILSPTHQRLYFALYSENSKMKNNRFGIEEPDVHPSTWLNASQMGLILLPLVAFDVQGNRLGMGGGFYDRSLNFKRYQPQSSRPYLIGLAHECQQVEILPCESWDVPLNTVATELRIY